MWHLVRKMFSGLKDISSTMEFLTYHDLLCVKNELAEPLYIYIHIHMRFYGDILYPKKLFSFQRSTVCLLFGDPIFG